ncbi:MAG: hypothetical protein AABY22_12115 [Nanoarchaeota archaeon]
MNQNIVHVKYDYPVALKSKKDLLELEVQNLNTQKTFRKYVEIRKEELKLRVKLQQKIAQTLADMKKLKEQLPSSQIPEFIKRKKIEIKKEKEEGESYSKDIETELQRIKEKLNKLKY